MIRTAHMRCHIHITQPIPPSFLRRTRSTTSVRRCSKWGTLWFVSCLCGSWIASFSQAQGEDVRRALFSESEKPPLVKRLLAPITGLIPRREEVSDGDPFIPRGEEAQRELATQLTQQSRSASAKYPWETTSPASSGSRPSSGSTAMSSPVPQRSYPWPAPIDKQVKAGRLPPSDHGDLSTSTEGTAAPLDEIRQAELAGVVKPATQPVVPPETATPVANMHRSPPQSPLQFDELPLVQTTAPPVEHSGATPHPPLTSSTPVPAEPQAAAVAPRAPEDRWPPLPASTTPPPVTAAPYEPQAAMADVAPDPRVRPVALADSSEATVASPATALDPAILGNPLHKALVRLPAGREVLTSPGQLDQDSRVLAIVGTQSILAGDVLGRINEVLAPYVGEAPADELDKQRELLMRQLLPRLVENKLVYMDFLRVIPPDRLPDVEKQASDLFHKEELPKLIKAAGVDTAAAYDAALRKTGSSLLKRRRAFMEQEFARTMIAKNVNLNAEVSHGEMLEYYEQHADEYFQEAQVRWERIMVRYEEFAGRGEAYQAIAKMGDQVKVQGMPFDVVARHGSHGPHASEGGQHDWTEQHSVASERIDRELFSLPVGKMSRIIEDDQGYHIVRVIERREAGRRPFAELQDEIQEAIVMARRSQQIKAYLDKLKTDTHVWTVFDDAQPDLGPRLASPPHAIHRN